MKHAIISRCLFNKKAPNYREGAFELYLPIFREYYAPSINTQLNKNFELILISEQQHFNIFKESIDRDIKIINVNDYNELQYYLNTNNIQIQTRHDIDDYMYPEYVLKIQQIAEQHIQAHDIFAISFNFNLYDTATLKHYKNIFPFHQRNHCTMFSTLVQKDASQKTIYSIGNHMRIPQQISTIFCIEDVYTKLIIHGNNTLSTINANSVCID